MKTLLHRDLADSTLGWLVLRILLPVGAVVMGARAITTGQIEIRGASVSGISAVLYGAAFVALGIAMVGQPSMEAMTSGRSSKATMVRLWLGMATFGVLIVAATIRLF